MFVEETSEQIDALVQVVLLLEDSPDNSQHLNEAFRIVHSIKGAAVLLSQDGISLVTHRLENQLDRLRSGKLSMDGKVLDLILKTVDYLRIALLNLREGKHVLSHAELLNDLAQVIELPTSRCATEPLQMPNNSAEAIADADQTFTILHETIRHELECIQPMQTCHAERLEVSPIDVSENISNLGNTAETCFDFHAKESIESVCSMDQLAVPIEYCSQSLESIRVDAHRLDDLMSLTSDLLVNRSSIQQSLQRSMLRSIGLNCLGI